MTTSTPDSQQPAAASPVMMTNRLLFARLYHHIRPYNTVFFFSVLAMMVSASTEWLFASLLKPLIDDNFVRPNHDRILIAPTLLVLLFLVRGIASFVNEYSTSWVSNRLVSDLRGLMFDKLLTLPARFFDNNPSGRLVSRISNDVTQVTQAGYNLVTVTVKDGVTVIGLLGVLLFRDWVLTAICMALIPLIALSIRAAARRLRYLSRDWLAAMGRLVQVVDEAVQSSRILRIFGGQAYETRRFRDSTNLLRQLDIKQSAASSLNSNFVQLMIAVALAVIVYYASLRAAQGQFTAGDFMSFMTAMLQMIAPVKRMTSINTQLQRGLAAAESVFALLDEPSEPDTGTQTLGRVSGKIDFQALTFHYGEGTRNALEQINLTVPAGKTIALVGSSGSGKTTLANLIPRFYLPTSGAILIDGINTAEVRLADLRQQIAMVSQEIVLFNDSIAANIAYGRRGDVADAAIEDAARAANAWDFIMAMPNGFETLIGENGVKLSGGQRQRIAIARAILKDAPILILDEATSALDTESERVVQAALDKLIQNRTTIVIAHRLTTIEKADMIVVLQHGRIVETGVHAQLLSRGGVYASLHALGFRGDVDGTGTTAEALDNTLEHDDASKALQAAHELHADQETTAIVAGLI